MHSKKLESFPPGNPFHHDSISTGARLRDMVILDESSKRDVPYMNLYIMYSGSFADGLYIVNANTGERIGIEL